MNIYLPGKGFDFGPDSSKCGLFCFQNSTPLVLIWYCLSFSLSLPFSLQNSHFEDKSPVLGFGRALAFLVLN